MADNAAIPHGADFPGTWYHIIATTYGTWLYGDPRGLAKFPRRQKARSEMGIAKKHATFEARRQGWEGKLWGVRGKEIKVRNRQHQLNVYRYILGHAAEGAWVWDWKTEHRAK